MVGIGQTSCMGSASIRQAFFLSQPAPCRYSPRTYTPSYNRTHENVELSFNTSSLFDTDTHKSFEQQTVCNDERPEPNHKNFSAFSC